MMRLWRVHPVRPGAIIQFGTSRYRGHNTRLADGTVVRRGAVASISFFNARSTTPMAYPFFVVIQFAYAIRYA